MFVKLTVAVFLFFFWVSGANAENPWGPECATVVECILHVKNTPECTTGDATCFATLNEDGLATEFEKFGRSSVPPLLDLLQSGSPTVASKAAQLLWNLQEHIRESERSIIRDAWRRDVAEIELLATNFADREFVLEVMSLLRQNPTEGQKAWQTFTNFRDYSDDKPNGIHAVISEHIDCTNGERCDPKFAKLQLEWLESNRRPEEDILERFKQAIENPRLDAAGKLAALQYFRPNEYGRTKEQLIDVAVPYLKKVIASQDVALHAEAAKLLAMYGVDGAQGVLITTAMDPSRDVTERISSLISLASIEKLTDQERNQLQRLLYDPDWNVRRHAVNLLSRFKDDAMIDLLIKQISPDDWLVSYSAVRALRDLTDEKAKKALRAVEMDYWHPIVREAAAQKLSIASNLKQLPAEEQVAVKLSDAVMSQSNFPLYDRQDFEILRRCKARFEADGYAFVPDFITGPDVVEEMKSASTHNFNHFRNSLLKPSSMQGAQKANQQLDYHGWKFLGTAPETGRGHLTAVLQDQAPVTVIHKSIAAVIEWNGKPYAITAGEPNINGYPTGDGFLVALELGTNGRWSSKNVLRLTGIPEVWQTPDQTIGILGNGGVMIVGKDGTPEWIGCPIPSFP